MPARPTRTLFAQAAAWAIGACGLFGCSASSDSEKGTSTEAPQSIATCEQLDASVCPQPTPSFANDIAPLLNRDCNTCHTPGSTLWPLTGYENVRDWAYSILTDVESCSMPPADGGVTLASGDRALLVGWIGCGAPNN
jgi:hypothetical protein